MIESKNNPRTRNAWRKAPAMTPNQKRKRTWREVVDGPIQSDVTTLKVQMMLDRVHRQLTSPNADVGSAMTELLSVLWDAKVETTETGWDAVIAQCVAHPVCSVIHEDPFASRCFLKPRGYAGDAVLIDYLYTRRCDATASVLGRQIFDFTRDIPAGHAVRRRRDMMADVIDEVCMKKPAADILSVACGHLREASLSLAVMAKSPSRFVALDQDELSLETVHQEVASFGVTTVHNSIKGLFRGPVSEQKFDLIYSTGLYDYLDDRLATKLTHRMFDMLNPGGRVVVANFVDGLVCSAYMEAMLDWKLVYRDVEQVRELSASIPPEEVATCKAFVEENGNIAFLDIVKK